MHLWRGKASQQSLISYSPLFSMESRGRFGDSSVPSTSFTVVWLLSHAGQLYTRAPALCPAPSGRSGLVGPLLLDCLPRHLSTKAKPCHEAWSQKCRLLLKVASSSSCFQLCLTSKIYRLWSLVCDAMLQPCSQSRVIANSGGKPARMKNILPATRIHSLKVPMRGPLRAIRHTWKRMDASSFGR